jgi:hypothetical protein
LSRRPARYTQADLNRAVDAADNRKTVSVSPAGDIDLVSANGERTPFLRPERKEIVELIYFVRAPINGFIKIGYTTNVEGRLAALRAHCAVELELLGTMRGTIHDERSLHARFWQHRRHGEWFASSPELLAFIAEVTTKP